MIKRLKRIFITLLAIGMFVQMSGVGTLFAQDLDNEEVIVKNNNESSEEQLEESDDNLEVENNVNNEDVEEDVEEKSPKVPKDSDLELGNFILTFKDYNGVYSSNAYIRTGADTNGIITYNLAGEDGIEANRLAFRLTFPKGADVRMPDNTSYTLSFGSANSPTEDPQESDQYTYVWFTLRTALNSAQTETINFEHVPDLKPGQIGTDDKTIKIEMDAFEIRDGHYLKLENETEANMISYADLFSFNNVSSSFNYSNQNVTTKTDGALSPIVFNQTVSSRHSSNQAGLVHTQKIIYTNKFVVEKNAQNDPYIKFTRDDIVKYNGSPFTNSELNVETNSAGYVTSFTIITEAVAPTGQQLSNSRGGFQIVNSELDKELVQSDFALQVGGSKKVYISTETSSARAIAVSKVSGIGNSVDLTVPTLPSTAVTYTNASETGDESSTQAFSKRLNSIANVSTIGAEMDRLAAYKNDVVVFDFGNGWTNKQEHNIDELVISEFANHPEAIGFNSEELRALRIQTGRVTVANKKIEDVTVSLHVIVQYSDGSDDLVMVVPFEDLNESQTISIPTEKQEYVQSIKFVYKDVDPNFTIATAPKIEYRVLGGDATKQGLKISNKAQLNYSYNNKDFEKVSNEAYFRFRDVNVDKNGVYKNRKYGENLSRDTFQEKDDVILFGIEVENRDNADVSVKTIKDEFTYNLSPYDGVNTVYGDLDSSLIDNDYIARDENDNALNALNLVLWKYEKDPSDPDAEEILVRVEDQTIIESIDIVESTDTQFSTMNISFKDEGIALTPGENFVLTYTMYTNDRFETDATIGNRFEALQANNTLVAKGEYWKSKPNDTVTDPIQSSSYNKTAVNASGTTLSEKPFVSDVLIYTITLQNKLTENWENITIEDTYSGNLSEYDGQGDISDKLFDEYGLREGVSLNLGVAKNEEGDLIMPEGFDADQITLTLNEDQRTFTINLGANVLEPNDKLELSYTLVINDSAEAKESIVNKFIVLDDGEEVGRGHHYWSMHNNAEHGGIVSNIKSVQGVKQNDRYPDLNRLVDGEELQYTVTLSNYLPRANRFVHIKNIIDYMPDYITYVEDSFELKQKISVLQDDGVTYVEETEVIDESLYTLDYDKQNNQLEVRFVTNFKQGGGVQGEDLNRSINNLVMTYKGLVDSTNDDFDPIASNQSRKDVTNTAVAFYEESSNQLVAKSGSVTLKNDQSKYNDHDDKTHSYLDANSTVQVLNENNAFGWISKKVLENGSVDVLSDENNNRKYEVSLYNTAFKDFAVTHVVDLLPECETVDSSESVMVIDNSDGTEYEAIYSLDTVTLEAQTYNRMIVTGYVDGEGQEETMNLPAITTPGGNNSMSIVYKSVVDVEQARQDLYVSDSYATYVRNRVAMYTDEEVTLFTPQGINVSLASKRTNDNVEETDWDSNLETDIRYETSISATNYSSAIVPYMDVRAQIVHVSASGVNYRNAQSTDYINPGDVVGWKVRLGNSNLANTPPINAGTTIVMELPDGLTFDGYKDDELPAFLEEVQVSDENRVLIWTTKQDINAGSHIQFTIRTTTRSSFYDLYTIESYVIPADVPQYGFFNSKVYASNEYRGYNSSDRRRNYLFEPAYGQLPEEFGVGTDKYHHLTSSESISALGNLSIGGRMEVQSTVQTSKKASTTEAPHFITLNDVEDVVNFSMYLDVYKVGAGVEGVVFMNRLAGENDRFVIRNQERRSKGSLKLVDDGNFIVEKVNATSGSLIERIDESLYTVQYAVEPYDYQFTDEDWDLENQSIWMTESELTEAGYNFDDVTATRTIVDNNVTFDMNEAIKVTYQAKLANYHEVTWEVYNSYAYGATVDGSTKVHAETRSIGLKSNIYSDRLKLVTEVIDPALVPLQTQFDIDVVGYDKVTHEKKSRVTLTVDVENVSGILENVLWLEALSRDDYYKVEANEYEGFRIPEVLVNSEIDQYGLTTWTASVTYERIVYDEINVDVEVVTINDKYPIDSVSYTLQEIDGDGNEISTEQRTLSLIERSLFNASDTIADRETGNSYNVFVSDIDQYTYTVEALDPSDLDTTGVAHNFKITYTQQEEELDDKEDPKDPEDKEDPKDPEDKEDPNDKKDPEDSLDPNEVIDNKDKDRPGTGVQDKTYVYIGVVFVALASILFAYKKSKKE